MSFASASPTPIFLNASASSLGLFVSREQGAGVSVTTFWKAGNVDYKKVPALAGLDLSAFRGKAREEVRVTSTA